MYTRRTGENIGEIKPNILSWLILQLFFNPACSIEHRVIPKKILPNCCSYNGDEILIVYFNLSACLAHRLAVGTAGAAPRGSPAAGTTPAAAAPTTTSGPPS